MPMMKMLDPVYKSVAKKSLVGAASSMLQTLGEMII